MRLEVKKGYVTRRRKTLTENLTNVIKTVVVKTQQEETQRPVPNRGSVRSTYFTVYVHVVCVFVSLNRASSHIPTVSLVHTTKNVPGSVCLCIPSCVFE